MRKDFLSILAILAALGSLASCGSNNNDSKATADNTETASVSEGSDSPEGNQLLSTTQDNHINTMGAQCSANIGVIEPFSCLDGEIIPIQVDGVSKTGDDPLPENCDRPSWLGGSYKSWCQPNARVGRLPNLDANGLIDDDVQNIFICRRYTYTQSPKDPYFEDVAIIQHRKSTGDTCFFQHEPPDLTANPPQKINASRVPPPAEPADETPDLCPTPSNPNARCKTAEEFWLPPKEAAAIGCHGCHAAGPFIRSPYISQVMKNGEPVIYPLSDDPTNNYRFLGSAFSDWNPPQYAAPDHNPCVACHITGYGKWYARLMAFSVGQLNPPADAPSHCQGSNFYPPFSATAREYPNSHWMPLGVASHTTSREEWDALYRESVNQALACLPTDPKDAQCMEPITPHPQGCNVQTFGPTAK